MSMSPFVVAGHPFPHQLAEALRGNDSRPSLDQLEAAAGNIRLARHAFATWLRAVAADNTAVQDIAKHSYWHPNGFAKIVLHTSDAPEFRIRLHIWPADERISAGEANPHTHQWEFASYVLVGAGMHMVEFTETAEGGRTFLRYRYGTDPGNPAALVADVEAQLKRAAVPHVQRGDVYTCDTSVVHTARPIDSGLTATVVVQGPRRPLTTVVYCEPGGSDDQPNVDLSGEDLKSLLRDVLTSLDVEASA